MTKWVIIHLLSNSFINIQSAHAETRRTKLMHFYFKACDGGNVFNLCASLNEKQHFTHFWKEGSVVKYISKKKEYYYFLK